MTKYKYYRLLLFLIILLCVTTAAEAQKEVHYRLRLVEPFYEIPFYTVTETDKYIDSFVITEMVNDTVIEKIVRNDTPRYRQYRIDLDENNSVDMRFFIFSSVDDAELHVLEYLSTTNAYPEHDSQRSLKLDIGNNAWYTWDDKIIVFIRNNVEVRITDNYSDAKDSAIKTAQLIDGYLLEKQLEGLSELVPVPVINSVKTKSIEHIGDTIEYTIQIEADDPNNLNLYYNIFGLVSENPLSTGEISGNYRESTDTRIWIINENNFVSKIENFLISTGVKKDDSAPEPEQVFTLMQNAPNPFNQATAIGYELVQPGDLTLAVYDMLGRKVAELVRGRHEPGVYSAHWNGCDMHGEPVSSGVYFYRAVSGGVLQAGRMTVLR